MVKKWIYQELKLKCPKCGAPLYFQRIDCTGISVDIYVICMPPSTPEHQHHLFKITLDYD